MDNPVVDALNELTFDELDELCAEYFTRAESAVAHGRDGWARLYAAIACAVIDAMERR